MTDYIVENCETAELNGTYIQVGPSFWERYDGEYYCVLTYGVEFDCMVLAVQLSDNDSAIYIDYNYGGDLPPDDPSIDWYSFITGTPSDLTVTAVSSGQNLTLTCAAGSYTLTGTNADFYRLSPTPACRIYVIKGDGTSSVIAANETYLLTKSFWGQLYWPANYWAKAASLVGTPTGREWNVNAENREYAVLMENRTYSVPYCTDDD